MVQTDDRIGRPVVTTSWDDGSPHDLKMMERLLAHRLSATFYLPVQNPERPVMDRREIRELAAAGFEIGSHTYHHRVLPGLSAKAMEREIATGKIHLEQLLGKSLPSFCYPKGRYNAKASACAARAGVRLARTTRAFHTGRLFSPRTSPLQCPVSLQAFPERPVIRLRHALKELNLSGALTCAARLGPDPDWAGTAMALFEISRNTRGVFHLWGHSWEIEARGLWQDLDRVFEYISGHEDVLYLTNGQLVRAAEIPA